MKYRQFGKTGMNVSEIGMGCWAIGGNEFGNSYGTTSDAESIAAIKKAVELGCNFFDTADVYGHGHSESLVGAALEGVRKSVVIATKVGGAYMYGREEWGSMNFSEDYVRFAIEQSLRRLRTNYIDVYQLHNPTLQMIEEGEVFRPLRAMQKDGKVKHVGISVHTLDEGIAALDFADSVQCVFNMLDPRKYELMETAKRRGIAIIVREPLANGLLTGKYNPESTFEEGDIRRAMPTEYMEAIIDVVEEIRSGFSNRKEPLAQLALRYILMFNSVSTVIPGAKTRQQLAENLAASEIPELTEDEMRVLGS